MRGTTLVHGCALSLFNAELRFALPIERIASRPCSTQIYICFHPPHTLYNVFEFTLLFIALLQTHYTKRPYVCKDNKLSYCYPIV